MSILPPLTRQLLRQDVDRRAPTESLIHLLEAAIELVTLPDNDFAWSSWADVAEAQIEIAALIATLRAGGLPARLDAAVLFSPTGPMQELAISSGWGDLFLIVAEKFDDIDALLWPR